MARLGVISMGEPYVVPLNFVYIDGTVYFHGALSGRKIEALKTNPAVCLEFDAMHGVSVEKQTTFYTSVVAWGRAEFLADADQEKKKQHILEKLCLKYLGSSPVITREMAEGTAVVAVPLRKVTFRESTE